EVARWLDGIAVAQVALIVGGISLVRKANLRLIMIVVFTSSLLLTLIQVATDNDTLALLFPWRTSAVLVPLATAIVLARLVGVLARRTGWESYRIVGRMVCWSILAVFFVGGLVISFLGLGYRSNPDEIPLLEFVRENPYSELIGAFVGRDEEGNMMFDRMNVGRPASLYLLPVDLPKLDSWKRGAASTNFTPAPRAGKSGHL